MDDDILLPKPYGISWESSVEFETLVKVYEDTFGNTESKKLVRFNYNFLTGGILNKIIQVDKNEDYKIGISIRNLDVASAKLYQLSVINLGEKLDFQVNIGIENKDLSIENIYSGTKADLEKSTVFQYDMSNEYFLYFAIAKTFVCEIITPEIKNNLNIFDAKPEVSRNGNSKSRTKHFSESNINLDIPSNEMTDINLEVGEDQISCNSFLLSMYSKVFEKMLTTDMKEAHFKKISLSESIDTIKALLNFMYGQLLNDEITIELMLAADKYDVKGLTALCLQTLKDDLDLENVAHIWETAYLYGRLQTAHLHSFKELSHYCIIFMTRYWNELQSDENIRDLISRYNSLNSTILALQAQENR